MSTLNIGILKKLIETIPDDYTVEHKKEKDIISPLSDVVEIDVGNQRLILK